MHKQLVAVLLFFVLILAAGFPASALNIEDKLADPVLESRAHGLFKEIRCMVCTGESIADSNAGLAKDLRTLIRDKIKEGNKDQEILDYITARYGSSVLMLTPLQPSTYFLWFAPAIMLLIASFVIYFTLNKTSV